MNIIDKQIKKIKKEKRIGLMTHMVIGYPSLKDTIFIAKAMEKAGVDFIEIQIPFSDPLADGPTIMKACEASLKKGTKVKDGLDIMRILSKETSTPIFFMGYYNNIFKYGVKKFCSDAKKAGATGLIVPDIPIEEEHMEHFIEYCKMNELYNIRVISPVSTLERIRKNAAVTRGFVYCTARQGVTGAQKNLDPNLVTYLKKIRRLFKVPLAVGFGISKKEHLNMLAPYADIAVVGSALIDIINKSTKESLENNVKQFLYSLQKR